MDNRTIITIFACTVISIGAYIGGYKTCQKINPLFLTTKSQYTGNLSADMPMIMSQLSNGGKVEIKLEDGKTPEYSFSDGTKIDVFHRTDGAEFMNFFGLHPNEMLARDQGIQTKGDDIWIGQSKGFGILERAFVIVRNFAVWIGIGIVFLCVLLLVPATRPIASWILRAIASVIPGIGSVIERVYSHFKYEKPLTQTVQGSQKFKDKIADATYLNDEQKQKVHDDFNDAQMECQDKTTQKQIKGIKTERDL
jgi:hypothetical protein